MLRSVVLVPLLACGPSGARCPEGQLPDAAGVCVDYVPGDPVRPTADVWSPSPGVTWQWQLSGTLDTTLPVDAYDVDAIDTRDAAWSSLSDRVRICYVSLGSWEAYRGDADAFPSDALGKRLDGWPDERWLDVTRDDVRALLRQRLEAAAARGCDAIEPDNIDGYANDNGLGLRATDQLAFNRWIADTVHGLGMSVGLKNDLDQIPALIDWFDWALNEECEAYDECHLLDPFLDADKAVLHVEYVDDWADAPALADDVCPRAGRRSTLIKTWDLGPERLACP